MKDIKIKLREKLNTKPKRESDLGFGKVFTDHMFVMDYDKGEGWHDPKILPYGLISLPPGASCFHYGQEVFEGLKAYRTEDGRVLLFRPEENMARLNLSNDRLAIPLIDEEFAVKCIKKLVEVDRDWIPRSPGTSLYIRPFIIGVDEFIGIHSAEHLKFIIICSPVSSYYSEGLNPIRIYVEEKYVRAVVGGMGHAKTGGNYAASLKAQDEAEKNNYSQVLWLDGVNRKYIEEVGSMNVFFVIGDEVVTPSLNGSILSGITRKSAIELLKYWNIKVTERKISIDEIFNASKRGILKEAFGTGTAAIISPIGTLKWGSKEIVINEDKIGNISQKLYDKLTGIQCGKEKDQFDWTLEI